MPPKGTATAGARTPGRKPGARRTPAPVATTAAGFEELYHQLCEHLDVPVFRKDRFGQYVYVNRAFCAALGCAREDVLGRTDFDLFPAETAEALVGNDRRVMAAGAAASGDEILVLTRGGAATRVRITRIPVGDADGRITEIHGTLLGWDVERARLEEAAFYLRTLMDNLPDAIYFKDVHSRFRYINRHTAAGFGIADPAEAIGKTDFDYFTEDHATQAFRDEQEIIRTGVPLVNVEEAETKADGSLTWVSTTKMPLRDSEGRIIGTFGVSRDITEHKAMEEQLAQQSFYDALTGLPNRVLFMNRLEQLVRRADRAQGPAFLFAILFLDLDRFKGVNELLGHDAGNAVLTHMARRLEGCLRPSDMLARLGGDEFAILLEDIGGDEDARLVAERIRDELVRAFEVEGKEIFSTVSVGIAISTGNYERPEDILRDAESAMHRAKASGRGRHELFDQSLHERAVSHLELETDLRHAVDRGELLAYYQPIVDLMRWEVAGFEALARWRHPARGIVSPDVFIPIAEEAGIIGPLGLWVLREACAQMAAWQRRFPRRPPLSISVNLSTRQLADPGLVDEVKYILEETRLSPAALTLEITESALAQNMAKGAGVIAELRAHGVHVNIDDFGTGYSSLSYLQAFKVDTLKIDRSFVSHLGPGESSEIVRAIIALAQSLGMQVTAEGAETVDQVKLLQSLRCENVQGFYFARPLPADEAERLLAHGLIPPDWHAALADEARSGALRTSR